LGIPAADVVKPNQIGTSAAIVNGIMFIVGGSLSAGPARIGLGIEAGIVPKSLELAQYAARPSMVAIILALAIAFAMREPFPEEGSYPPSPSWSHCGRLI
jgi:hypothetical protein